MCNQKFVYILKSEKNSKFYIGSTNNVQKRLEGHNSGNTKSTEKLRPWKLVFYQLFESKDARKIELKLKKLKRRDILEKIVSQQNIHMHP